MLARAGKLDYLTLEYLAELTMSILARQKQRDPQAGFATDFIDVLEGLAPILRDQPTLRIVTNAGGMNPVACAASAYAVCSKAKLSDRMIGIVDGDDLLPRLDALLQTGHAFKNLDTGEDLQPIRDRVVSANAYLGAQPIVEALRGGASMVITGRVADASLTLGPLAHAFGWGWDHWDLLSAGTVAGHLIECGAQVTGGLWCNWREAVDYGGIGYPIAAVDESGTMTISKPTGSGGAVNRETVIEQLLYEVGDPSRYLTPDVVADFTTVALEDAGGDVVRVSGARGRPATDSYKVSIAYRDGFMASGTLTIGGPEAFQKARATGEMILDRLKRAEQLPEHSHIECLGAGDCVPGVTAPRLDAPEIVLRVAVRDSRKLIVERFAKEMASPVCSGLPATTGYTGGRPVVREVFAYWPTLVAKSAVEPRVTFHRGES
jgi:hypothetical protein